MEKGETNHALLVEENGRLQDGRINVNGISQTKETPVVYKGSH